MRSGVSIVDEAAPSARERRGPSEYLGGFSRYPLLSRDDEVELARRVEDGELSIARAFVRSRAALRELGAVGEDLAADRLRARDVLRAADDEELADERTPRLVALFGRAGALGQARGSRAPASLSDRRALLADLGGVRLHRRILERVVRAIRDAAAAGDAVSARALADALAGRRAADRAKARLVESNLRLVVSFAKRFLGQGLELHDLIQEGNIGLMRAIDKFDHRRGHRFSTYASWWVRQQMARAISEQARTIRVPVHLGENRQKLRRVRQRFTQEHGRAPSLEELLDRTGLSREQVEVIDDLAEEPLRLEAPAGRDREAELGDFTADRSAPPPDEGIARARMREETRALLETLTPREQDILRRRFGLDDTPEHTLAEIGASISLSRERIRQIEAAALRKLRAPSERRDLESYLDEV